MSGVNGDYGDLKLKTVEIPSGFTQVNISDESTDESNPYHPVSSLTMLLVGLAQEQLGAN